MPVLMLITEGRWLRQRQPHLLGLACAWAKSHRRPVRHQSGERDGPLSELGLLRPAFMELFGHVVARRQAIAQAMGPVWEAHYAWLIFALVLLFSAFLRACGSFWA